jgi:phytanoyl-CoA hydroxylase
MKLNPKNYEEYWSRGWTVVEGVFPAKATDEIIEVATAVCIEELKEPDQSSYLADRTEDGQASPRKIAKPFLKHPKLRAFAVNRNLRSLIAQLVEKPPLLVGDQVFMKPPQIGSAKPYHQDNAYFLCHPDDDVITAWIALDDVDEENGCLRYINGSHRGGIVPHIPVPGEPHNKAPAEKDIDLTRQASACVKKGGVVFHHGTTLHTSHRNRSKRWRRAYATHWVSADTTSERDTIKNGYFNAESALYEEVLTASKTA